jgi:hypothetical protein
MKIPKDNKNTIILKEQFKKEKILQEIAIGKILGDGHINVTGNFNFGQSIKQKEYVEHCFNLFKNYTSSGIKIQNRIRKGTPITIVYFNTRALFKDIMQLFYKYNEETKRIKIVPKNISYLLTARSLAYWIMDDGCSMTSRTSGMTICTHSFTKEEVELLKETLELKFKLNCSIKTVKIRDTEMYWYVLQINKESHKLLWELVGEYIIPSMRYKFGR